ncbi:hypothetical protein ACFQ1I_32815 [Kitasatospora arboriphila]
MIALLLGGGFGAGAWLWWTGLRPPRPTLAEALNRRAAPVRPRRAPLPRGAGWAARAGAPLVPALLLCRLPGTRLAADLRTLGIPAERHLAEKAGAAMAGLLIPWGPALLTAAAGSTGFAFPAWTALLLAALLFCTPDLAVRRKAERYRAEMRQALSAFLDLVVVALSGGAASNRPSPTPHQPTRAPRSPPCAARCARPRSPAPRPGARSAGSASGPASPNSPNSPPRWPSPEAKAPRSKPRSPARPPPCAATSSPKPRPKPQAPPSG